MKRILHVALEGGPSVIYGGLGRVATQMVDAQNRFKINDQSQFEASIITPFYPNLHTRFTDKKFIAEVKHLYNNHWITSKVYWLQQGNHIHYFIEPPPEYKYLFNISTLPEIYKDNEVSYFIERVKFFNSAVAAYVGKEKVGEHHPDPQILQLHDWQASLVPKLLTELYHNSRIKSVFMVHIDSGDRGTYACDALDGIGLKFNKDVTKNFY